jgi:hypothetical protein
MATHAVLDLPVVSGREILTQHLERLVQNVHVGIGEIVVLGVREVAGRLASSIDLNRIQNYR